MGNNFGRPERGRDLPVARTRRAKAEGETKPFFGRVLAGPRAVETNELVVGMRFRNITYSGLFVFR